MIWGVCRNEGVLVTTAMKRGKDTCAPTGRREAMWKGFMMRLRFYGVNDVMTVSS